MTGYNHRHSVHKSSKKKAQTQVVSVHGFQKEEHYENRLEKFKGMLPYASECLHLPAAIGWKSRMTKDRLADAGRRHPKFQRTRDFPRPL